ncbi:MAG: nucleotidyltransferase family protein [Candidatus Liptonbacteria bacterium]|nr:nucleotidyltransferase family protein [Candidatus Liptonbacteria bacterium]
MANDIHNPTPQSVRQAISPILARRGVGFAGIFGSCARGEMRPDSDVDILVRFSESPSLLGLVALERELSGILGRKVEIVTERSLCPHVRENVMRDMQVIHEGR